MTLATLETKLSTLTGTLIGSVIFDWKAETNDTRGKSYPYIVWALDGANFTEDYRTSTIQKVKIFTLNVYAVASFNSSQNKITVWDTLESQVRTYLNKMNTEIEGIQIVNIDKISGQYAGEGLISADQEIGIILKNIVLKMTCN